MVAGNGKDHLMQKGIAGVKETVENQQYIGKKEI
jgi:hypothetical protein